MMTKRWVIDSSVFVSALGQPDEFSLTSRQLFFQAKKTSAIIFVPTLVLTEVLVNLNKQKYPVENAYDVLSSFKSIPLTDEITILATKTLSEKDTSLKTSDFIIALSATIANATLITWDHQLLTGATFLCPVFTPTEVIAKV